MLEHTGVVVMQFSSKRKKYSGDLNRELLLVRYSNGLLFRVIIFVFVHFYNREITLYKKLVGYSGVLS